jgi:hypothetical protein
MWEPFSTPIAHTIRSAAQPYSTRLTLAPEGDPLGDIFVPRLTMHPTSTAGRLNITIYFFIYCRQFLPEKTLGSKRYRKVKSLPRLLPGLTVTSATVSPFCMSVVGLS